MRRGWIVFWLVWFGCSDDHAHTTPMDPTCALLAAHCHGYDTGPGTPHDCHQVAEANNVPMCVSRQAECLAACPAGDAGVRTDAAADAPGDVPSDTPSADGG
jgi:hypothetical protein